MERWMNSKIITSRFLVFKLTLSLSFVVALFVLSGCTVAVPEISTNSEIKDTMLSLSSGVEYSISSNKDCQKEVTITGACDKRIDKLNISLDNQATWKKLSEWNSTSDDSCSDGQFSFKISNICTVLNVSTNETTSKSIFLQGDLKIGKTTAKEIKFNFSPTPTSKVKISIQDSLYTNEGGTLTYNLSLDRASTEVVTVQYQTESSTATSGTDYQAKSGTITFNPGETTKSIDVLTVVDGVLCEANESVQIRLSNPVQAELSNSAAQGYIIDTERPTLSIADLTVLEAGTSSTTYNATVSLSAACPNYAVSFNWSTADGTALRDQDYLPVSSTVATIAANQTSVQLPFIVLQDSLDENDEYFYINLANASQATIVDGQAIITITDDDPPPTISLSTPSAVSESSSSIVFNVTLSSASGKPVTVMYATSNNTAIAGSDYTATNGTLSFSAGETSKAITVPILDDAIIESTETFTLTLSSATNATLNSGALSATGTITDNDVLPVPTGVSLYSIQSPNNVTTPQFTVTGVTSGDTVRLFTDQTCATQVGSTTSAGTTALVTLSTALSTEGLYTIYANRTSSGFTSSCSTTSATYNFLKLTIAPVYTNAAKWNDYIRNNGSTVFTATDSAGNVCDGTETGGYSSCIHGGEKRKVDLPGLTSCSGLTMKDNLNVFNWGCVLANGTPRFYSIGLKAGKGLGHLIAAGGTSWASFYVSLYQNGSLLLSGAGSTSVWENTIYNLTTLTGTYALGASSYVYTISSNITRGGISLEADKIALVALPGYNLKISSSAKNCIVSSGETGTGSSTCLVTAGSQKFLWIEGAFDADGTYFADYTMLLYNISFSRLHNVMAYFSKNSGIYLSNSNNNFLTGLKLAYHNSSGSAQSGASLYLSNSNNNQVIDVTTSNNNYSASCSTGANAGILIDQSSSNSLVNIISVSNYAHGISLINSSTNNTISNANVISNGSITSCSGIYASSTTNTNLNNILALNNSGSGLYLYGNSNIKSSLIYAQNNTSYGIADINSSGTSFSSYFYKIVSQSCSASGTSPGISSGCLAQNSSSFNLTTGNISSSTTFSGNYSDGANPLATSTSSVTSLDTVFEYLLFQNSFRVWQPYASIFPSTQGLCQSGSCGIWDYSLKSSDTFVKGFLGYSDTFQNGSICPSVASGNNALSFSSGGAFLTSATEVLFDGVGNDNGLCESGETCIYSPNAGVFQGFHTPNPNITCTFSNGTVSNVKLIGQHYAYMELSQTSTSLSLLNGNLSVKKSSGSTATSSRANLSHVNGKWYYEVKIESAGTSANLINSNIGIGTATSSLTNYIGSESGTSVSYGYDGSSNAGFYTGGVLTTSTTGFAAGDIIGVAVDLDSNGIWFSKNGVWLSGNPADGTSPAFIINSGVTYFPMISISNGTTVTIFTSNFGQNLFYYPIPTGFNAGWF